MSKIWAGLCSGLNANAHILLLSFLEKIAAKDFCDISECVFVFWSDHWWLSGCEAAAASMQQGMPVHVLAGGCQIRGLCSGKWVCCRSPKFRMKIRVRRCGGGRRCCGNRSRGTRSRMFRHVISQLAKFPTFKTLTFPIALNGEAIGVAFQRGQNCSRCQQKARRTKNASLFFFFFFPCVFSPWSCLPISL